jgi:predicted O-linked N-acetylglucosamine transferase (SPINDLY family)
VQRSAQFGAETILHDQAAVRADSLVQSGIELHQAGRIEAARDHYQEALRWQPRHARALRLLGVIAARSDDLPRALELLRSSIQIDPLSAAAHVELGNALFQLEHYEAAIASYDLAVALRSELQAEAYFNRGNALRALSQHGAAVASYDQAIAARADHSYAYFNRGLSLAEIGRHDAAIASMDAAIAINPDQAELHFGRGNLCCDSGRYLEAIASYDRAVALQPDSAEIWSNRGNALASLRQFQAAIASFDRALALKPDSAEACNNRGNALRDLNHYQAAIASYDLAIALRPGYAEAYNNRGNALSELKLYEAAIASYDAAIAIRPDFKFLRGMRQYARMHLCDWTDFDGELAALSAGIGRDEPTVSPSCLLSMSGSSALQRRAAQIWVRYDRQRCSVPASELPAIPHERLRVGYFSPDFHIHPVSVLAAELFETHDRSRFETFGFSFGVDTGDAVRCRVERAFARFIDVRERSDRDIAQLARSMELDIAVDLAGFTQGSRPGVFGLRAAPVQVGFLGYPSTMGGAYVDYLVADRTVIPACSREHYAEKIIYLPHSFMVNDCGRAIDGPAVTREQCGLPEQGVVYCCFNSHYKIVPALFERWMRVLRRVAGSVLWLPEGGATVMANLRAAAEQRDVDSRRLVFAPRLDSPSGHLARLRLADLFLDTLPYNAHATAVDALWAGLPLLTCAGEAFAGRVAASLLSALEMPELISASLEEYEELAVALGQDAQRLAAIRQQLAARRLSAPLFDTRLFTRHLEAAYRQIYQRHQADAPPADLFVNPADMPACGGDQTRSVTWCSSP